MFFVRVFLFLMSRHAEDAEVEVPTSVSDATRQSYRARLKAQTESGAVRASVDDVAPTVTRDEMTRLFRYALGAK